MKAIAGIAAAGVLAGAAALAPGLLGGRAGEPPAAPPVAGAGKKFDIPVWHPDARWAPPERFASTPIKTGGELDGPRLEVLWREPMAPALASGVTPSSNPQFMSYDAARERYHVTAGSARGCTDGPFSRARFGGWDYSHRYWRWSSPDGRYTYLTEPYVGYRVVRRLDWEKQEVTSIDIGSPVKALAIGEKGQLYMLDTSYKLAICTPDGKVERRLSPEVKETLGSLGWSVAVDEARGRLYAGGFEAKAWYHWYWDLKDGSFHGVLPKPQKDEPQRQKSEAGPFKGTVLYGEGLCYFGPDDPERRYLYSCRVDTNDWFRLDLEKEHIWCYSGGDGRFISEGVRKSLAGTGGVPNTWLEDGSFVNAYGYNLRAFIYRRTK